MAKRTPSSTARRKARGRGTRQLTEELARTWLITTINPVLEGLRRERVLIEGGNLSWRYGTRGFEFIRPVREYVDHAYLDNLVEFREWYPTAAAATDRHDDAVIRLADTCGAMFDALIASAGFVAALTAADAEARRRGVDVERARGTLSRTEWAQVMAEYVINDVDDVPGYYTTSEFWRVAGAGIRALRRAPAVRDRSVAVERATNDLRRAVDVAKDTLVRTRKDYTTRFGIPPVPLITDTPDRALV